MHVYLYSQPEKSCSYVRVKYWGKLAAGAQHRRCWGMRGESLMCSRRFMWIWCVCSSISLACTSRHGKTTSGAFAETCAVHIRPRQAHNICMRVFACLRSFGDFCAPLLNNNWSRNYSWRCKRPSQFRQCFDCAPTALESLRRRRRIEPQANTLSAYFCSQFKQCTPNEPE